MRKNVLNVLAAAVVLSCVSAFADLQNVTVGGQVRIRGNWYSMDNRGDYNFIDEKFVEQRTLLNVRADFTDNVSAFIEMDSIDTWGEDFRSNYLTGIDGRAGTGDDAEMYQAYIDAKELFGSPLQLRVGRQELSFGSEWLLGNGDSGPYFTGLSFDGLRLTYQGETFSVDAFGAKLAENSPLEEDGDTDLYGVYASCKAVENMTFDAYWLYVRDAFAGVNDLHTFGLRAAGKIDGFHFEAEAAYQFGEMNKLGLADDDTSNWACNTLVGYVFDTTLNPHPFIGFAYYGGGDDNDLAFNRLFSDARLGKTIDNGHWIAGGAGFPNANVSNVWLIHGGVTVNPTETLTLLAHLCYAVEVEDDWAGAGEGGQVGWEMELSAAYNYSKDLSFEGGYVRLFPEDNLKDGAKLPANGLAVVSVPDDVNYFFFETKLNF
jgi:hypothetical protein